MPRNSVLQGGGCTASLVDFVKSCFNKVAKGEKTAICSSDMIAAMMRRCTEFQMTRR